MTEVTRIKRPSVVSSVTYRVRTGCDQSLYVTVGTVEDRVIEVFLTIGKTGGCHLALNSALGIAISEGLQHGVPLDVYVDALKGVKCDRPVAFPRVDQMFSCPDAVYRILDRYLDESDRVNGHPDPGLFDNSGLYREENGSS